jgi:cation diffusion facilitator family transporter
MIANRRQYYERNNSLIQQYLYIDKLLDSSLPHDLIQEYQQHSLPNQTHRIDIPNTITEEVTSPGEDKLGHSLNGSIANGSGSGGQTPTGNTKVKRTPKNLYKVQQNNENTPLLQTPVDEEEEERPLLPDFEPDEDEDSQSPVVTFAIYLNLAANTILLILKIIVTVMTSSVSVLASLVDAALDFLSTAIIWTTTRMISQQDQYKYPVGRRRLEPIGVLLFSVIMITSFFQVALEGLKRLTSGDHEIVQLSPAAVSIMSATVIIKGLLWVYCRLVKNSSVQALAQDAMTDVVFNIFSIIFPLIGYFAEIWWLDSLGGILLAFYVITSWSFTTTQHIRNLTGAAATADERNVLLYLTMRFAKTIKQIQGLQAYHAGDKLNVEVDVVLDEGTSLRDSHDLGESLQYVLESVPTVDRAFVHLDYLSWNIPTHMQQQE